MVRTKKKEHGSWSYQLLELLPCFGESPDHPVWNVVHKYDTSDDLHILRSQLVQCGRSLLVLFLPPLLCSIVFHGNMRRIGLCVLPIISLWLLNRNEIIHKYMHIEAVTSCCSENLLCLLTWFVLLLHQLSALLGLTFEANIISM